MYQKDCSMLKLSTNNYIKIPVVNDSNKDVNFHRNTKLGYLESIKSIVPLKIDERQQLVVNIIISNEADKPVDKQTFKHKQYTKQKPKTTTLLLKSNSVSLII